MLYFVLLYFVLIFGIIIKFGIIECDSFFEMIKFDIIVLF